ncbi:MAG TPA: PilZ domain-containing protein [Candidatus Acidoferrales bacterium]
MNGILELKIKEYRTGSAIERVPLKDEINLEKTDLEDNQKMSGISLDSVPIESAKSAAPAVKSRAERRKHRRAAAKVLVRLRPADSNEPKFEEVLGTLNASRANLYVVTTNSSYYKLMRLRVTFPFDCAHDNDSSPEATAQVMRLDHLANGRTGVAIQLNQAMQSESRVSPASSTSVEQMGIDQRISIRHPFSASAALIDTDSNTRLEARCSDLSVAGCYIDTLNPFLKGSRVLVRLTCKDTNFVALAQVITHHVGMGMGLAFEILEPAQKAILADWLCSRLIPPALASEVFQTPQPPAVSQTQESSNRALLLKMLRMLETNGRVVPF